MHYGSNLYAGTLSNATQVAATLSPKLSAGSGASAQRPRARPRRSPHAVGPTDRNPRARARHLAAPGRQRACTACTVQERASGHTRREV